MRLAVDHGYADSFLNIGFRRGSHANHKKLRGLHATHEKEGKMKGKNPLQRGYSKGHRVLSGYNNPIMEGWVLG
jgi:hypothetical protein